jgi:hypothetical protein
VADRGEAQLELMRVRAVRFELLKQWTEDQFDPAHLRRLATPRQIKSGKMSGGLKSFHRAVFMDTFASALRLIPLTATGS